MVAWFLPALKAVLPHLGVIVSAATPVFTKRSAEAAANQALVLEQIAELQAATSQNAGHIKELAAQLQTTVASLEQAASLSAVGQRRLLRLTIGTISFSLFAFGLLAYLIFAHS